MGLNDWANYIIFNNPISKTVTSLVVKGNNNKTVPAMPNVTVITEQVPLWKLAAESGPFVRIAAVMGASAAAIGAYGAHKKYPKDKATELKQIFEIANRYHFFHSLALFAVPLCRNPKIAGTLIISGTILFSGTLYYHAFTNDARLQRLTPIGGTILILGWLSMVF